MCLISLGLVDPNKFSPVFTFSQPGVSIFCVRFVQPIPTYVHRVRFPWTARPNWLSSLSLIGGPKQIFTCVHFRSALFLKFFCHSFRSASGYLHTCTIRFSWPAWPNWLSSLSLLDPNKCWPVFTFPQPSFSNFIGLRFAQPLNTNIYRICFPWPARPNWLSSLSLMYPNKIWPRFTLPQPGISNFICARFAQPLDTNT